MKNIKLIELNTNLKKIIFENKPLKFNYFNQINLFIFQDFLNLFSPLLQKYNCNLVITNAHLKKKGHIKYAFSQTNKIIKIEMKLVLQQELVENLYLLFHELTHLINEHPIKKDLTKKQKEVVADTVAKALIFYLSLDDKFKYTLLYKDLNIPLYGLMHIQNGTLSLQKYNIILNQIRNSISFFINILNSLLKK